MRGILDSLGNLELVVVVLGLMGAAGWVVMEALELEAVGWAVAKALELEGLVLVDVLELGAGYR